MISDVDLKIEIQEKALALAPPPDEVTEKSRLADYASIFESLILSYASRKKDIAKVNLYSDKLYAISEDHFIIPLMVKVILSEGWSFVDAFKELIERSIQKKQLTTIHLAIPLLCIKISLMDNKEGQKRLISILNQVPKDVRRSAIQEAIKTLCDYGSYELAQECYSLLPPSKKFEFPFELTVYHIFQGLGEIEESYHKFKAIYKNIKPGQTKEFQEKLAEICKSLYKNRQIDAAGRVIDQILGIWPANYIAWKYHSLILAGEREWNYVTEFFNDVEGISPIFEYFSLEQAYSGLFYLYNHNYLESVKRYKTALDDAFEEQPLPIQIGYWLDSAFVENEYDKFPYREIEFALGAQANLAFAYYLSGKKEEGFSQAQKIIDLYPDDCIGYRVLGCLHYSEGNMDKAREAWTSALGKQVAGDEKQVIQTWLEKITAPS